MSKFNYDESRELEAKGYSFDSLIMTAMRQADSINSDKLKTMWPYIRAELQERYDSPGGLLESERDNKRTNKQ